MLLDKPIIVSVTQIVSFHLLESSSEIVLFVDGISYENIHGKIIAYSNLTINPRINMTIYKPDIREYRILTKKDLPLYIGFGYTTPLLAQLLQEDTYEDIIH